MGYLRNGEQFDQNKWMAVFWYPSWTWIARVIWLKLRKKRPTVVFAEGQDQFAFQGLNDEDTWVVGGAPDFVRKRYE